MPHPAFFLDIRRGSGFSDRVKKVGSLIAHWSQSETSGTVITCLNNNARNGVYTGVTLNAIAGPHGYGAPQYDAINDVGNIYSDSLSTALTNLGEGTALVFARMLNAGVWTDGASRRLVTLADATQSNKFALLKHTVNNQLRVFFTRGGASVVVTATITAATDWFALALSFSAINNRLRGWYSTVGVSPSQLGTTQTGVVAWSGVTLSNIRTVIGADDTTPLLMTNGYISDVIVWNTELDFSTQLSPLMVL